MVPTILSPYGTPELERAAQSLPESVLLLNCRVTDLARLYTLCARIQALEPLKTAFRDYIGRTGLALVLDEEKACIFFLPLF